MSNQSALKAEEEDQFRLRKARENINYCQQKENEARTALAQAAASTKRAREKWETLFHECETRAIARRKAGLITVNPGY